MKNWVRACRTHRGVPLREIPKTGDLGQVAEPTLWCPVGGGHKVQLDEFVVVDADARPNQDGSRKPMWASA